MNGVLLAGTFRCHLLQFMSHKAITKIGEYRQEITSSRIFASLLCGFIRGNSAKFFNILSDFNTVGIAIILAKNVK